MRGQIKPTIRGHEAGEAGAPPLESKDDPHEHPIVEAIRTLRDDARSRLDGQLDQAHKQLVGMELGDINAVVKEAESRFNGVAENRWPELQDKRLEVDKRRSDLRQFRHDNDLDRSPNYPESGWLVFSYGLVALLFVVESFANSVFLARGDEGGILGAYTIAFAISFANLIPAFVFFGPFSRNVSAYRPLWRVLAWLMTSAFLALAFLLNLGVAHYREVSGQLIGEGGVQVVQRMIEAPLSLQDAQSWLLFVIGLIFSFIAFFDGWKLDDAYPGYGKLDRIWRKARKQYLDMREDVTEELDRIRQDALDRVRRVASDARKQPQERKRVVQAWRQLCDDFERHVADLQGVGSTLINEYREANHKARSDGRVPRAHENPWRMPPTRPIAEDTLDGFDNAGIESRIEQIQQEYRVATDRIHERCDTARKKLLAADDSPASRGSEAASGSSYR